MKIEGKEITLEDTGSKVTYIPNHAHDDVNHVDCLGGTIASWNNRFVFVNYGTGTNQATDSTNLVWG